MTTSYSARNTPRPYVDEFVIDTLCGKFTIVVRSNTLEERELHAKCEKVSRNIMVLRAPSPFQYIIYMALRYYKYLESRLDRFMIEFPILDLTQSAGEAVPSFNEIKIIIMVWY
jgi:hypothetical protein